jgi:hypothetical protein
MALLAHSLDGRACPKLVGADIRAQTVGSGVDPKR